jgi:hypothetical protein
VNSIEDDAVSVEPGNSAAPIPKSDILALQIEVMPIIIDSPWR